MRKNLKGVLPHKKITIEEFSAFISEGYSIGNETDINRIASSESVEIHYDDYGSHFDGMLVRDGVDFHIHVNESKGNYEGSKRSRFTISHELGHFFLEEHREAMKADNYSPHASNFSLNHENPIEIEADYFAACLLMPKTKVREFTGRREFSLDIIKEVSDSFNVSVHAATRRFIDIGTHEIFVVFSRDNKVLYYDKSEDFPKLPFKFKVGASLPKHTVAFEYFNVDRKYSKKEQIYADCWFSPNYPVNRKLFEQCLYSDSYGFAMSIIWFE